MMKLTPLKALSLMLLGTALNAHAAINLDRTRIVFPEGDKASSLKVDNQSKTLPYLALSWIEDENGRKEDSHFMALPPIQRIEAGASSQVRSVKQAAVGQLPKDRESLFYFNLREVPPNSGASEARVPVPESTPIARPQPPARAISRSWRLSPTIASCDGLRPVSSQKARMVSGAGFGLATAS